MGGPRSLVQSVTPVLLFHGPSTVVLHCFYFLSGSLRVTTDVV